MPSPIGRRTAIAAWVAFVALLLGLPLLHELGPNGPLAVADSFYRTGALVFGGGHVVLPLLQAAVVSPGWVTERQFTAGYGAAQAIPGPLFTFSTYLGFIMRPAPHGVAGAGLALVSIFLPAGLLVVGTMRFWNRLRANSGFRAALNGVNAAVVGLLLAALYHPVWTTAIGSVADVVIALVAFALLQLWRLPPWSVVLFAGISSALWQALR
jgi:chromate transporter